MSARRIPITTSSDHGSRLLLQAMEDSHDLPTLHELEKAEGSDYTWSLYDIKILKAALRNYAATMSGMDDIVRRAEQLAQIADAGFETVTRDLQEPIR